MEIISADDLASWLRDPSLAENESFAQVVDLTNELITEEWTSNPTTPAPVKVQLLAFGVATRAWTHNPAASNLESVTRTVDGASRTERYRSAGAGNNVYLTSDELAVLQGKRTTHSIRLVNYGQL